MQEQSPIIKIALAMLGVTIVLGGGIYFYNQYGDGGRTIEQLDKENAILENKIEVLSSSAGQLQSYSQTSSLSLPNDNAGILAINTMQDLAIDEQVVVSEFFLRSYLPEAGEVQVTEFGFTAQGESANVLNYLSSLSKTLPIIRIKEIETSALEGNLVTSNVTLETYSQAISVQLPALTEPLQTLTGDEENTLNQLAGYKQVQLSQGGNFVDEGSVGRENPFSNIE